jgi:uncharacterized protein YecT (DUF1311 family)
MRRIFLIASFVLLALPAAGGGFDGCPGAQTQRAIDACAARQYQAAGRKLDQLYARAMALQPGADAKARLADRERDWIGRRDRICEREASDFAGGSMRPTIQLGCLRRETETRIRELQQHIACRMRRGRCD